MVEATCHCGAVRVEVPEAPADVFECNCSICRRLGALWAYYPTPQVGVHAASEATLVYRWGKRRLGFHTCRTCGCTTHWVRLVETPGPVIGVNARLIEGLSKTSARVNHLDGAETGLFWTEARAKSS